MDNEKTKEELLKEKLFYKKENAFSVEDDSYKTAVTDYAKGYKAFLDAGKTEREACTEAVRIAESNGFKPFVSGTRYNAGDRVYLNNRGKSVWYTNFA